MSKDLVFFDKEGNFINTKYNTITEKHEGELIFHENSSDTHKTIGLYLFENIKSFEFEANTDLQLSKFQLFNEYGFNINGSSLSTITLSKIEPTNSDVNYFTKWLYAPNIENIFKIGSSVVFKNSIAEFSNINQTYTVLNSKRGAIMIISNENNLLYSTNNVNVDYSNTVISGVNYISVLNYFDQNLNNLISNWSEPNFYEMLYNGRKLNLIGTESNNMVVTVDNYELLDKINYKYTCPIQQITEDLTVTVTMKTNNPNIYYGGLVINDNIVYFLDGVPKTLLPGRSFKIDSILNTHSINVSQIGKFSSNIGSTDYIVGAQVIFNNKIYQCFKAYTQYANSIITPSDEEYWSSNITYIAVDTTLTNETISSNVYLTSHIFTYNHAFDTTAVKTAATFVEKWKSDFNLLNIDLLVLNGKIVSRLIYSDNWADVKYKLDNLDITTIDTSIERLISVREELTTEKVTNISEQTNTNIVFTDISEYGILITINGMPYREDFVGIYNANILDLERSIDKTIRNWLSKNYVRLYALGITCVLKSIRSNNQLYYNTISLNSFYPNVSIDFEVEVGTVANFYIEDTLIIFKDMGSSLSIRVLGKEYQIGTNSPIANVQQTLTNWVTKYQSELMEYGVIVSNINNALYFDTKEQTTLNNDVVVTTSKLDIPGDNLFNIIHKNKGNSGAIITSNSIILSNLSEVSFENSGFATGMIVGVNNTTYPFNNQDYNILSLEPHVINLSYQGPFWDTNGDSCWQSPFITIAFNNGFEGDACAIPEPTVLSGEFNNDFASSEFLLEYTPGNTYDMSTYNIDSYNMVDVIYLGISNTIYVLGNNITIIDSLNNVSTGTIDIPNNNNSKCLYYNSVTSYVMVLTNNKLYTVDPILNTIINSKTITLSIVPNKMAINTINGDVYITHDLGFIIIDIYNNIYTSNTTNRCVNIIFNKYENNMYINSTGGVISIDGNTRALDETYIVPLFIESEMIYDNYDHRVYVFGSDYLYYISNGTLTQTPTISGTNNYVLHNNLTGDIITNTDVIITSTGTNNFSNIANIGDIYMNQYDGYIYITTTDGSRSIVVINSVTGHIEEIKSLSNNATKLIFNPDRNTMMGIQSVDSRIIELSTTINLNLVLNPDINSSIVDGQFGSLSPDYTQPEYIWLNTHDYIRRPRANFIGDAQMLYNTKWVDDTTPEIFLYDISGDQLSTSGSLAYIGEKPLPLITLNRSGNKDINKITKSEFQQTIFEEILHKLDFVDSDTNLSFLPEPIELFIGHNDINEGVKSNILKIYEKEEIIWTIVNNADTNNQLDLEVINGYGILKLNNNSSSNFLTHDDGSVTGLKVGQMISILLYDTINTSDKYISNNNHLIFKIRELYNRIIIIDFTNGNMNKESNVISDYHGETLYLDTSIRVIEKEIASFTVTGQTEIEDIRFKLELDNVGQNISVNDTYIFKDYDINEQGIDWIYLNKKRKELLINRHEIYPYIGSYKAIINAINYFGYNDLELYEYYRNIDTTSTAFGDLYKVEIPDIFDNSVIGWNESDYIKQTMPNSNYEDTNLFNLAYRITDKDGNNILSYSLREVLIKLQGLKYWLQDNVIPMSHEIMDITGQMDFVNTSSIVHKCYDTKSSYIRESMSPINFDIHECYLMPINSGSTVYDVVVDFSVSGSVPDYFTIDVTTYKTEKEWSPFQTYNTGDKVSYYNFIYESVLPGKNRVKDPRRYTNTSKWSSDVNYKTNDIVRYADLYFQLTFAGNTFELENQPAASPLTDTSNWRNITEWKEVDYVPVQTIKEFRTTLEPFHIVIDSNLDPYININITSDNGYGQIYKMIKNYEIRGTKDLTDVVSIIEVDPLPVRLGIPPPLVPPSTTTTSTTTTSTTTSTTTTPPNCYFDILSASVVEITTTTSTTTAPPTTTTTSTTSTTSTTTAAPTSITLDSYLSGCLYFTITGPVPSGIIVEESYNGGSSWISTPGSYLSPRCGFDITQNTTFRLISADNPLIISNSILATFEVGGGCYCDTCVGSETCYAMITDGSEPVENVGVRYTPDGGSLMSVPLTTLLVEDNLDGTFKHYICSTTAIIMYDIASGNDITWPGGTFEVTTCPEPAPVTVSALRSGQGYLTTSETDICMIPITTDCKIATQNNNQITSGDVMYELDGITPFNGDYKYYNLALSLWTEVEGSRVCYIDNIGVISINTICSV